MLYVLAIMSVLTFHNHGNSCRYLLSAYNSFGQSVSLHQASSASQLKTLSLASLQSTSVLNSFSRRIPCCHFQCYDSHNAAGMSILFSGSTSCSVWLGEFRAVHQTPLVCCIDLDARRGCWRKRCICHTGTSKPNQLRCVDLGGYGKIQAAIQSLMRMLLDRGNACSRCK